MVSQMDKVALLNAEQIQYKIVPISSDFADIKQVYIIHSMRSNK